MGKSKYILLILAVSLQSIYAENINNMKAIHGILPKEKSVIDAPSTYDIRIPATDKNNKDAQKSVTIKSTDDVNRLLTEQRVQQQLNIQEKRVDVNNTFIEIQRKQKESTTPRP